MSSHRKTFEVGETIEFKRDVEHAQTWEPGIYVREDPDMAWHSVRCMKGERFFIPSRRIRKRELP